MGQVPGELAGWAASGGDFGREEPLGIGDCLLRAKLRPESAKDCT